MITTARRYRAILLFAASVNLRATAVGVGRDAYDLGRTKGMECFDGSAAAKELLARNGFVVADPAFKQIFEPYIKSPSTKEPSEKNRMEATLPSFITTDSAWHTYHVLLEEGVKDLEVVQAQRLARFSRLLLDVIREQAGKSEPKSGDLASFASIGLAFQDENHRQSLALSEKRIADELRTGLNPVGVPIGFSLSPVQFRAQSFYAQSPKLSDYFVARQWYASVAFRLANARETKLAIVLATLIDNNPELLTLWKQLSDPFDTFLASAEDGTVPIYAKATKAVLGTNLNNTAAIEGRIAEIQRILDSQLPSPRINDQLLSPEQYADFSKQTRGFRLLPPRRLPCAVCFHNSTDPKIPGRTHPSGLDFLAASPVLRSSAAVRALKSQFGKSVSEAILKADCGPMPDSLHGEAMQLLAKLQEPLPAQVAPALRTEAWADLQLWSQLGAWAEQRHTWALHTKLSVSYLGIVNPPVGMVAPYPEFFAGLAKLSRRTAEAFEKAGLEQRFDVKAIASDLIEQINLLQKLRDSKDEREFVKNSGKLEQLNQFQELYYNKHRAELENDKSRSAYQKLERDLEELGRRCAASGKANEAETETLRSFFESRQSIVRLLNDFAPVCDRLAELAKKSLSSQALTEDDAKWIRDYGVTLAGFHFYHGNSYEVPKDDFPMVTRVFSNPLTSSMLYAGLSRPQAIYVIVPTGSSLQLYRGAVMTYREFVRADDQPLDDESWRELVSKGQAPPPPPFTRSFCSDKSVAEWMQALRAQLNRDIDYEKFQEILWQLDSRVTAKELPEMIDLLANSANSDEQFTVSVAKLIGQSDWEPKRNRLLQLVALKDTIIADCATDIFLKRPENLDSDMLISGLNTSSPRTRRLLYVLLSNLPKQTEAARNLLLQALDSNDDGIRWQAALALGQAHWRELPPVEALLNHLNDSNQFVAAAAALSLGRLGATNCAPTVLAQLKTHVESDNVPPEEIQRQAKMIKRDLETSGRPVGGSGFEAPKVLDPDNFCLWIKPPNLRRGWPTIFTPGIPPQSGSGIEHVDSALINSLIEALGLLRYKPAEDELVKLLPTSHATAAVLALQKLAPERLEVQLLTTALNKEADPVHREEAMVYLCYLGSTNQVRKLIPLLDDTTTITYERMPADRRWEVCDRAADTIACLLGWHERLRPFGPPSEYEALIGRAREWGQSATSETR
jgi:HEAT repeat protein